MTDLTIENEFEIEDGLAQIQQAESDVDYLSQLMNDTAKLISRDEARVMLSYATESFREEVGETHFTAKPSTINLELGQEGFLSGIGKALLKAIKFIWRLLAKIISFVFKPIAWLIGDTTARKGFSGGGGGRDDSMSPHVRRELDQRGLDADSLEHLLTRAEEVYAKNDFLGKHVTSLSGIASSLKKVTETMPVPLYNHFAKKDVRLTEIADSVLEANSEYSTRFRALDAILTDYPFEDMATYSLVSPDAISDIDMSSKEWDSAVENVIKVIKKNRNEVGEAEIDRASGGMLSDLHRRLGAGKTDGTHYVAASTARAPQGIAVKFFKDPIYGKLFDTAYQASMAKQAAKAKLEKPVVDMIPKAFHYAVQYVRQELTAEGGWIYELEETSRIISENADKEDVEEIIPSLLSVHEKGHRTLQDLVLSIARLATARFSDGNLSSATMNAYEIGRSFSERVEKVIAALDKEQGEGVLNNPTIATWGLDQRDIDAKSEVLSKGIENAELLKNALIDHVGKVRSMGEAGIPYEKQNLVKWLDSVRMYWQAAKTRQEMMLAAIKLPGKEATLLKFIITKYPKRIAEYFKHLEILIVRLFALSENKAGVCEEYMHCLQQAGMDESDARGLCQEMGLERMGFDGDKFELPAVIKGLMKGKHKVGNKTYKVDSEKLINSLSNSAKHIAERELRISKEARKLAGIKNSTVEDVTRVFMAALGVKR